MDRIIPTYYRDYGRYINQFRAFPHAIDGLKLVERRLLLSCYEIARDKFVKSAKIDGHCLGNYHPHGSSYGTLVQLVQMGFIEGQGNWGSVVGIDDTPPAAMRYTEAKLSKWIQEIAFKYIDYVPWIESELENEPEYLSSMVPLCLIGKYYNMGIGFGYRSVIPSFSLSDIVKRLMYLIGKSKKVIIKPLSDCEILSSDKELEELLTTGKSSIKMRGKFDVDKINSKVIIYSWPYGKRFQGILSKLSSMLENKEVGYIDNSTTSTKVVFEVLKQRNKEEILNKLVKKIKDALEGDVHFEIIVVDQNKNTRLMSVDEMLLLAYNNYKNLTKVYIEDQIFKIKEKIDEYKIIEKLKPYISDATKIKEIEKSIEFLHSKTKIDIESIRNILNKYRIIKLLTISTDISELDNKLKDFEIQLKNIDEYVDKFYNNLLKI